MKKFLYTIFVLFTLFLIFYLFYTNRDLFFDSKKLPNIQNVDNKNLDIGKIKSLNFTQYSDMSDTYKNFYDSIINQSSNNEDIKFLIKNYPTNYKDFIVLLYADSDVFLVFVSNEKSGGNMYLYSKKDMGKLDYSYIGQNIINGDYLIFPCVHNNEESFCYYKAGDKNFAFINNSNLTKPNETYVGSIGPGGDEYSFTLNIETKKIFIQVFKNTVVNNNYIYTKLREVEFTLP